MAFGGFLQTSFAAVSFACAGYLFKLFDSNIYEEEMICNNKAGEKLNEKKRQDRLKELRQELSDANRY